MTIVVEDTEIPVHKAILALYSPVFEAMFSHNDTKEAQEKKVVISDVEADVMRGFLHFVYTGVKPEENFLSPSLLAVADKVCILANVYYNYFLIFIICFIASTKSKSSNFTVRITFQVN